MSDSYTFTVGKLDAGMAILIGERASLIEFPSLLLPPDVAAGSIVNISVRRNEAQEHARRSDFEQLQQDILSTFGSELPRPPALRVRNVTQTSITLEWDKLHLASASLLSLDIYRSDRFTPQPRRLAAIPNPRSNTSTKLSGLDIDAEFGFHLVLSTTAGVYASPVVKVRTHKMTDVHGISVCFGHVSDSALEKAAREHLDAMGARYADKIQIETTHFICDDPRNRGDPNGRPPQGTMFLKAQQLSIPVLQPHWIFACKEQGRMVPIASFYLGATPPNTASVHELLNRSPSSAPAADAGEPQGDAQGSSAAAVQAAGRSEPPPTPSTAAIPTTADAGVVTPGSIPRIDASLAEDATPAVVSSEPHHEPDPTEVVGASVPPAEAALEEGEKTPVTARDTELPSYAEPSAQPAPAEKEAAPLPELEEDTDASFDDVSLSAADESSRAPPADDDEEEVDLS